MIFVVDKVIVLELLINFVVGTVAQVAEDEAEED